MTKKRKTSTLIGSDKGGVGKSTFSLMQITIYDNAGYPLRVVEIDNQRKLSSLLGKRVDLSLNAYADIQETSRNRHAVGSFYNPVYLQMAEADSIVDFGANVTTPFMEWFHQFDMGTLAAEDDISFRFVACASPDRDALAAALTSIESARRALGSTAEYFVVLNDIFGQSGFSVYEGSPEYLKLVDLEARGMLKIIRVDYCDSLLLEHGKAMGLTPLQIVDQCNEVAEKAGLDPVAARVHRLKLMRWLQATQTQMEPLLMVYSFTPKAA